MAERPILMTGASGFLGRDCLRLFAGLPAAPGLVLLLRQQARERLQQDGLLRPEWEWLEGDLSRERLGLSIAEYERLARRLGGIFHCAGNVRFDLDLRAARQVNLGGTQRLLELAAAANSSSAIRLRFDHVSTAYVVGRRSGSFVEGEGPGAAGFCNSYEQSKWEAEQAVLAAAGTLAVTIYRPSIILPTSPGQTQPGASTPVWCARVFRRGRLVCIPGQKAALLDLIGVDQVARALVGYVTRAQPPGGVIHLSAGCAHSVALGELVELAARQFGVRPPPWMKPHTFRRWVRPLLWLTLYGRRRSVWRSGENLLPYLEQSRCFEPLRAAADFPGWYDEAGRIRARLRQLLDDLQQAGRL
jgi:nucleoside-diphosphate-sugar epimerase